MEDEIAASIARRAPPLGDQERQQLLQLGADLERAWTHPAATAATRKRILRTALNEIVVRQIARLLNRSGKTTGHGNGWTEQRVRGFRKHYEIEVYRDGEWTERGAAIGRCTPRRTRLRPFSTLTRLVVRPNA